ETVDVISVACSSAGKSKTADLTLVTDSSSRHFGIYPAWRVAENAALIAISGPAQGLRIDGVSLPAKSNTVAVLPGRHLLSAPASSVFAAASVSVEATGTWDRPTPADMQPKLSAAGQASASKAILDALHACPTTPFADPCVQVVDTQYLSDPWQIVGDPAADLSVSVDG